MGFDILWHRKMLVDNNILVIYSGPLWAEEMGGMAETVLKRLELYDMPLNASQSIFSVFIEQMNNMMMYSAETELIDRRDSDPLKVTAGVFILGKRENTYFIQTGNAMKEANVGQLKERIDYLNTLDKKELREFYKERMKGGNDNPESKGAGLGLIEIARRSSTKIEYAFTPYGEGLSYFTMYVTI